MMKKAYYCQISLILLFKASLFITSIGGGIGVNYGTLGDNLPPPAKIISLLKSKNINRIRIYNPNHEIIEALRFQEIELVLGTLNQDLQPLAVDPSYALTWVQSNVLPYAQNVPFRYITAGNEVIPSELQNYVLPAMQNLKNALKSFDLTRQIPVTTVVATSVLNISYPPSLGEFSPNVAKVMAQIAAFLVENQAPLLVNVYPYFAYVFDQTDISLCYATFTSNKVVVQDGVLEYRNLFDAMVDAVHSALERVGSGTIEVVVGETGWPSKGNGDIATTTNAAIYNNNAVRHVLSDVGTPKRPGKSIEAYIFAVFNEDLKPIGTEQNFGLFYPNMTEVYHVDFTGNYS